jgi:hypothetical protein
MLLVEMIINWYFMHGYDCVGRGSSVHLPMDMACFKGLAFTFDGKNQRQWCVMCNIG